MPSIFVAVLLAGVGGGSIQDPAPSIVFFVPWSQEHEAEELHALLIDRPRVVEFEAGIIGQQCVMAGRFCHAVASAAD